MVLIHLVLSPQHLSVDLQVDLLISWISDWTTATLDGSNLLNLPAQPGEGVNLKDDGFVVGAAKTVNADWN